MTQVNRLDLGFELWHIIPCRYSIPLRDGMWNEGVLETVLRSLGPSKLDTVPLREALGLRSINACSFMSTSEFSESFLPEHGTRSVDKNYTMFKEFIALTMKEHIPNKLTSTRTNLPWFNRGLKRMCKVKRRRFKRAKKSKKSRDWERYVAHKKATASVLKAARWDHLNGILQTSLEEKNTKPFYRYIKAQKTIILVFPL